jgi:hypothetical protein
MRVSDPENFKNGRPARFLFFSQQKIDSVEGMSMSGFLNGWTVCLFHGARGGGADDAVITLGLVLQLEQVPCLPQ